MKVYEIMSAIENLAANQDILIRDCNGETLDFNFEEREDGEPFFACDLEFVIED